ncbi:hypothetical protein NAPIS_ORF01196 [Vairimorpha apis BRL 01]|uniref:Uncharacterized protein n=1 Tax=Vairimorpha apis BRL 01 TaxID=1037528 RepID=T0MJS5_9MICR|nr:hypothetical protein NAPIS_ORF01196 [Vairimorpha apis BRL 01]
MDLIYCFINKLGDDKLKVYILSNISSIIEINQDCFILNLEDFYFKNRNYKCTSSIIKVLDLIIDKSKLINIYKSIIDETSLYKDEHRNIILENSFKVINTFELDIIKKIFSNNNQYKDSIKDNHIKKDSNIDNTYINKDSIKDNHNKKDSNINNTYINIIQSTYTNNLAYYSLLLLHKLNDTNIKKFIYKNIFKIFNYEEFPSIIKSIYEQEKDDEFIIKIFYYSLVVNKDFTIFVLNIINDNKITIDNSICSLHYSGVVRNSIDRVVVANPFDNVQLDLYEGIYN